MRAVALGLVVLGLAGCFQPAPTGHVHPAFRMFVDGQEVPFDDPTFDLAQTGFVRCHMHRGESQRYVIHIEGELGITLQECFREWGMEMRSDHVRFHPDHGHAARSNNATHDWQLWTDLCSDGPKGWFRETAFEGYRPTGHTRMLLTFAPKGATVASLQAELDSVPTSEEIALVTQDAYEPMGG